MRRVQLHGAMGAEFGEHWELDIATPAEAFRAISANCPRFLAHLMESDKAGVGYRVVIGERDLNAEELGDPTGRETLHLVPMPAGAKSGFGKIILGAAFIALSFVPGLNVALFAGAPGMLGTVSLSSIAFGIGVNMVLGGVAQMLAGTPKSTEAPSSVDKPSYYFNGPTNRMQQGDPVPIGYGRMLIGAMPVSAGISTENIAV